MGRTLIQSGGNYPWQVTQAKRVSRKSDLGEAMAYMLRRQDGFSLFLDDGHVDIDSNLVENAIRSPAMNRACPVASRRTWAFGSPRP